MTESDPQEQQDSGDPDRVVDELITRNASYADSFEAGDLDAVPTGKLAVVACMDARVDVYRLLGLQLGEAHVIRNAGGIVTDDVIRSLVISQRSLGTREVVLIRHTDCGMLGVRDEELKDRIEAETGVRPPFDLGGFSDLEADLRRSLGELSADPFLKYTDLIRGFVYDVSAGRLTEVKNPAA